MSEKGNHIDTDPWSLGEKPAYPIAYKPLLFVGEGEAEIFEDNTRSFSEHQWKYDIPSRSNESTQTESLYPIDLTTLKNAHVLEIKVGNAPATSRALYNGAQFSVGRSRDNDLVLNDPGISRKHCVFLIVNNRMQVQDLDSGNGTMVNGRVLQKAYLRRGDEVKLGITTITYHYRGEKVRTSKTQSGITLLPALKEASVKSHHGTIRTFAMAFVLSLGCAAIVSTIVFMGMRSFTYNTPAIQTTILEEETPVIEQSKDSLSIPSRVEQELAIIKPKAKDKKTQIRKTNTPPSSSQQPVISDVEPIWQQAIDDYSEGKKQRACSGVRRVLEQQPPYSMWWEKARSFLERKCS